MWFLEQANDANINDSNKNYVYIFHKAINIYYLVLFSTFKMDFILVLQTERV